MSVNVTIGIAQRLDMLPQRGVQGVFQFLLEFLLTFLKKTPMHGDKAALMIHQ